MVEKVPCARNGSAERSERAGMLQLLEPATSTISTAAMVHEPPQLFPTVDVPEHVHYTIGAVIFGMGITGIMGNFLVIYAFTRSRSLRTPANIFILNLAITDFFMCATQMPVFFITSMHKRWIFGEKVCELYAFCGALFGICSMITLMVIAVDRYFVITRPLSSISMLSKKRALLVLACVWVYSLGWSLPPFFGWSAYVPEGLMTSCTWDYITFVPSVRAYTMMLFIFVFFIPLIVIIYCYVFIFYAIRNSNQYADMLTPYTSSVPAVIAKASAIHNPIIYAITHPKYRVALLKYIPCLRVLLCVPQRKLHSRHSSFVSTKLYTITTQASVKSRKSTTGKSNMSSASDGDSDRHDNMDSTAIQIPRIMITSESGLCLTFEN
ncbi:Melanopsin-A [Bagarius yarrelli]|uniref:Melanopsin-A n=1 Tax=Bagarius yarrelli TaxID=175774 RepID=A0A556TML1_BAGYA|nr:Melanopsin-A [Bagarius yarrelli]